MATDPVCGMQVDEQQASEKGLKSEFQGESYYFCAAGCKRQFDKDPEKFLGQSQA